MQIIFCKPQAFIKNDTWETDLIKKKIKKLMCKYTAKNGEKII